MEHLDLSNNPDIQQFMCGYNKLSTLDISNLQQLSFFSCEGNNLSSLDLSHNHDLTELYCSANNLSELNLSKATRLKKLACRDNQLTTILGIGNSDDLVYVSLYNNKLGKKTMRKIAEEIVARSDAEEGEFYGIDTSLTPKDGNVVTKGTVEKLHLKAWKVYDYQGGANGGKNPYEGIEDTSVKRIESDFIYYSSATEEVRASQAWQWALLYDASGCVLLSSDNAQELSLSSMPLGVYFLKVHFAEGNEQVLRIVR